MLEIIQKRKSEAESADRPAIEMLSKEKPKYLKEGYSHLVLFSLALARSKY